MDADWELEEGIPQVEDPFIQKYLNGRNSLIAQEQKQRHGQQHHQIHPSFDFVSWDGPNL